MKIVCISDTHCQLADVVVPDGDVLVHAGDLTYRGTAVEVMKELTELARLPHRYKILVAGNHDWLFQKQKSLGVRMCVDLGIVYLEDASCNVGDLLFYGSPWQPEFCNWAFNLSRFDGSLAERWSNIPGNTDVLITHGPPQGIGDRTMGYDGEPPEHVGCYDLRQRVQKINPRLHVFGHIHHGYGRYEYPADDERYGTVFINASTCNEKYKPVNAPIVVDL